MFQFYAMLVQLRRKRPAYNIKTKGCESVSTLQIQTVLFNNEKSALLKSLDSIKRALEVSTFHTKEFNMARVCCGDASPVRLFSGEEINELNQKYGKVFSLSYTYFDCNTGTSKGHNLLAKNCEMDYLILMNPDVIFSPRFLIEVMKLFHDENLNAGIVEGRQTPIEHPKDYDKKTGETSWSSGACSVIKTETFHQVGGYDEETFFMYGDDVDLSWRVKLLGKKIIYQPLAPVFHAKRLSGKGQWQPTSAEKYYSAEAALLMAYKWSNNKLLSKLISTFKSSSDENLLKAVENFELRKEQNSLPEQLDKEHKVSQFINGNYAEHRFLL